MDEQSWAVVETLLVAVGVCTVEHVRVPRSLYVPGYPLGAERYAVEQVLATPRPEVLFEFSPSAHPDMMCRVWMNPDKQVADEPPAAAFGGSGRPGPRGALVVTATQGGEMVAVPAGAVELCWQGPPGTGMKEVPQMLINPRMAAWHAADNDAAQAIRAERRRAWDRAHDEHLARSSEITELVIALSGALDDVQDGDRRAPGFGMASGDDSVVN